MKLFTRLMTVSILLVAAAGCSKIVRNGGGSSALNPLGNGNGTGTVNSASVNCSITSAVASDWSAADNTDVTYTCTSSNADFPVTDVECQVNEGDWNACQSATQHRVANVSEGQQFFRVQGRNSAGNVGISQNFHWKVDRTPPEVFLLMRDEPTTNNSPVFRYDARDNDGGSGIAALECKLDNSAFANWADCSDQRKSFVRLPTGRAYAFVVRAKDRAGNLSPVRTLAYQATQPTLADGVCYFNPPFPNDPTASRTHGFQFGCQTRRNERLKGVECRLDNGTWAACQTPTSQLYTNLPEGIRNFEVRFLTPGTSPGDPDLPSLARGIRWRVDFTPPFVNITHPNVQTLLPSFAFVGGDGQGSGVRKYECKLYPEGGSANWEECVSAKNYQVAIQAGRPYRFHARATDYAGNVSADAIYRWVSNPGTGPSCQITTASPANGYTRAPAVAIYYACSSPAPIAETQCSVNQGAFGPCSNAHQSYHYVPLTDGVTYQVRVRARDTYGNWGHPSVPWYGTADRTLPVARIDTIEIDSPMAKPYFSANDRSRGQVDRIECSISGVHGFGPCTSPVLYTGQVLNQTYEFLVRAYDKAGNVSVIARQSYISRPAYNGPSCTLLAGPTNTWTNTPAKTFGLNCDYAVPPPTVCSIGGGAFAACTFPLNVPTPHSGTYGLVVRCVDTRGFQKACGTDSWMVDRNAPTAWITGLDFVVNQTQITFNADDSGGSGVARSECKLDSAFEWKTCTSPHLMAEGRNPGQTYIFRVRAVDGAGNVGGESAKTWINGDWSAWTASNATCYAAGTQTRTCTNPSPLDGGLTCQGVSQQAAPAKNCPVATNGGWSAWGSCSQTCGGGTQSRGCVQSNVDYLNSTCVMGQIDSQSCNTQACCLASGTYLGGNADPAGNLTGVEVTCNKSKPGSVSATSNHGCCSGKIVMSNPSSYQNCSEAKYCGNAKNAECRDWDNWSYSCQ